MTNHKHHSNNKHIINKRKNVNNSQTSNTNCKFIKKTQIITTHKLIKVMTIKNVIKLNYNKNT